MSGKVKYNSLNEKERMKYLGEFYDMVSLLESREEVKNFLKDLLTLSETVMISRRIQVAKRLLLGETYEQIANGLGVGKTTITQVDRWLNNGFGGYKKIIKKYNNKNKKNIKEMSDESTPFTFANLKKKYPSHFLLLNLLDKNE